MTKTDVETVLDTTFLVVIIISTISIAIGINILVWRHVLGIN